MKYTFRKGIAMIELIFAIVIIGITLLSAPMLLSQSVQSNLTAFQQESIAIAAAHANTMMTYTWDEQNTEAGGSQDAILTVTSGDIDLDENVSLRGTTTAKTPADQRKRRFSAVPLNASLLLQREDASILRNDIDDFNNVITLLRLFAPANSTQQGEYIDVNVEINTSVDYGDALANYNTGASLTFSRPFNPARNITVGESSNIKRIITTLSSTSPNADLSSKTIVLQSFMCNIGAANPIEQPGY